MYQLFLKFAQFGFRKEHASQRLEDEDFYSVQDKMMAWFRAEGSKIVSNLHFCLNFNRLRRFEFLWGDMEF
jgi:hypothetical protein